MNIDPLHYINQSQTESEILEEVKTYVEAGGKWLQLRIKNPLLNVKKVAVFVKDICAKNCKLIINDFVEIALEVDAEGVHLGLNDTPISHARKKLGYSKIIGGTANTLQDCLRRQNEGVNYIGLGPMRFTKTKNNLSTILGLSGYEQILKSTLLKTPIIAIGGIQRSDISPLREIGVWGIACSRLIFDSADKEKILAQLFQSLNEKTYADHSR